MGAIVIGNQVIEGIEPERQEVALRHLQALWESGGSLRAAATACGVTRQYIEKLRRDSPGFNDAVESVLDMVAGRYHKRLSERAMDGEVSALIAMNKAFSPEVFATKPEQVHRHNVVITAVPINQRIHELVDVTPALTDGSDSDE